MTSQTKSGRDEHLAWAKARALAYVEQGNLSNALASFGSDLNKWREPLYPPEEQAHMLARGFELALANDTGGMLRWIESFR